MNDSEIEIGMQVEVSINDQYYLGIVKQASPPYQLSNEKRYEVHGVGKPAFTTITSARSMRKELFSYCTKSGEFKRLKNAGEFYPSQLRELECQQ